MIIDSIIGQDDTFDSITFIAKRWLYYQKYIYYKILEEFILYYKLDLYSAFHQR